MYNMTRNNFALVCAVSLSSIIFWPDTVASADANPGLPAWLAMADRSSASSSSSSSSASAAVAAAASSDARAASPVLLHERIAAAHSSEEKMAVIRAAPNDEVALSLLRSSKQFLRSQMEKNKGRYVSDDSKVAQLHRECDALTMRLAHERNVMLEEVASCHDSWSKYELQKRISQNDRDLSEYWKKFSAERKILAEQNPDTWRLSCNMEILRGNYYHDIASYIFLQHKEEKAAWQKRERELQAQLSGYDILENGRQIEGMPNVPGGIQPQPKSEKKKPKCSSSCKK